MEQGTASNRGLIILCSVLALILGTVIGRLTPRVRESSTPITISTPLPTSTSHPTSTPRPLRIYISGAVRRPTVYELPRGSIVRDAIDAAGGPDPEADLACVNLALELQDQQQVHVPRKGEVDAPAAISGGDSQGQGAGASININTATAVELETLPGVGPKTAQLIIAYREANGEFETVEEIQNVSGIGPKTFEGMRDRITVRP